MTSQFATSGFFVLRTPLLPFKEWLDLAADAEAPGAAPAALAEALDRDRTRARDRLRLLITRSEVREALFLASPSFVESLSHWLASPDSERGQKTERILCRYIARLCGRATPFGLFAGCSVGTIAGAPRSPTALRIAPRASYQRHTRLDGNYLTTLAERLAKDEHLRDELRYRPNGSLYSIAGQIRYAEARVRDSDRSRFYHLIAAEASPYVLDTLARAATAQGETPAALARALCEADSDILPEEATDFIHELIDGQLLLPELTPPVTGAEPIFDLIDQLSGLPQGQAAADRLQAVQQATAALDRDGLGLAPERYQQIATTLSALPAPAEMARLFQVDLVKAAPEATLGQEVIAEIIRGVAVLHRLSGTPARTPREDALARFRDAFQKRYEDREVPLTEVLDEESGIGFASADGPAADASPLLAGLAFPAAPASPGARLEPRREALLLAKLHHALEHELHEIELTSTDLAELEVPEPLPPPDAIAVMGTLIADGSDALARGDYRVALSGAGGPSGADLLGRFCHGDPALTAAVSAHLRAEERLQPQAVFAEIVHLPEGRVGNIILRPLLRDYELSYLGRSGAPAERQIPLGDLYVSLRGGRVVLRSQRLEREVLPRLTAAHNFNGPHNLGVYRFLCALRTQGVSTGLSFRWTGFESAPFLPRLVCGRLVLAPAQWTLSKAQIRELAESHGADRFAAAQRLRAALRLPRVVALAEGDMLLPLDLDSALSIETGVALIKDRRQATLSELHGAPDLLCAHGPEGRFVHEFILPLVRVRSPQPAPSAPRVAPRAPLARSFAPGSEWLYVKLYTGTATADRVLDEVVKPVVEEALASGAADGWFFIRYGDPDWHVRLRLHGHRARLCAEVLPALHAHAAPLLGDGRLWRLTLDSYQREVERYGGAGGIVLAERLFQADSDAVLALLPLLRGDSGADLCWRLLLCGMDRLLADLGLDAPGKRAVVQEIRDAYARELRLGTPLARQLGERYRREGPRLQAMLMGKDPIVAAGLPILERRSAESEPVIAELHKQPLTVPIPVLAQSYLHMHANRMLRSAARAHELVLYDLLLRLYESQIRRSL